MALNRTGFQAKDTNLSHFKLNQRPGWDYLADYNSGINGSFPWMFVNFIRRNRRLYRIGKSLLSLKRNGIKKMPKVFQKKGLGHLSLLKNEIKITKNERGFQENTDFPIEIKISIIVSLCNTPEQYLKEMIDSVTNQTYRNWELCLVDMSDAKYENTGQICKNYAGNDSRIKYLKTEKVQYEAENLNIALEMANGEYISVLDQFDKLHPSALFNVMTTICRQGADFLYTDEAVFTNKWITFKHYKPDFAIDTLRSHNYINNFFVFSKKLVPQAGVFRTKYEGNHNYDLILRYVSIASKICHIPLLLYFKRNPEKSFIHDDNFSLALSGENIISEHLKTRGISARVDKKFGLPGFYRVVYELTEKPLVSIIIPNKDNISLLRDCLTSIMEKTTYNNYEIIIVENNSTKESTFAYYNELKRYANISVVNWKGKGFNFSDICNYGAQFAKGDHFLFLNNDVIIITPNWIEEMLMYSQRKDVGIVGIKLYFLNGAVQHAGVILGLGGVAGHVFLGASGNDLGFMAKLQIVQNLSAVTAACMMIKRQVFEEAGCFSTEFSDLFNDVDLCLKVRSTGRLIVWTPYAEAFHLESVSRGYYLASRRKHNNSESKLFSEKWGNVLSAGDPYYNCNFSLDKVDYNLK